MMLLAIRTSDHNPHVHTDVMHLMMLLADAVGYTRVYNTCRPQYLLMIFYYIC